jgi:hypothetical protein
MGAEGGRATFQKYGRKHMKEIGARGFASLVARRFGGDKEAAIAWLHAHASESEIDRLVSEKQRKQIADGAVCVAEEVPIIRFSPSALRSIRADSIRLNPGW